MERKHLKDKNTKSSILSNIIITAILTAVIAPIANYYFAPSLVETSLAVSSVEYCQINSNKETHPLFTDNKPKLEVYFDNNNEGFVRVNKVTVRTKEYVGLKKSDISLRSDIGGQGDIEKPIYLKSKVSSIRDGTYDCEYDNNLGSYTPNEYIELVPNSGDKFFITLDAVFDGIYDVEIEIEYTYHGKTRTIVTDNCTFVYINQPINNFYN